MDLAAVMDEIAVALGTIPDLRVIAYPPDKASPPVAIVSYPDSVAFDEGGVGFDRMPDLAVVVIDAKTVDRIERDRIAAYVDRSGPRSVKAAVEGHTYTSCDTVHVTGAHGIGSTYNIAGVDYPVVVFAVDITGAGA